MTEGCGHEKRHRYVTVIVKRQTLYHGVTFLPRQLGGEVTLYPNTPTPSIPHPSTLCSCHLSIRRPVRDSPVVGLCHGVAAWRRRLRCLIDTRRGAECVVWPDTVVRLTQAVPVHGLGEALNPRQDLVALQITLHVQ